MQTSNETSEPNKTLKQSTKLKDDIYYEVVISSDDLEVLEFFGLGLSESEGIEFLEDNILKLP
ncbi:hypothetical protein [Helicobacter sp. 11S02629-2]|uniref:hypothetical protein n=1 Tax=Helicobacter sp. 11S02629-2 TaxID=1476195 RepID=UPI000BA56A1F|nr:hypothetical protein [Helicobacter sp. 11S02629-2]PAF43676.1 hypothetical protein BKH40_06655 [Helicobacter sp. 11S02629-2]